MPERCWSSFDGDETDLRPQPDKTKDEGVWLAYSFGGEGSCRSPMSSRQRGAPSTHGCRATTPPRIYVVVVDATVDACRQQRDLDAALDEFAWDFHGRNDPVLLAWVVLRQGDRLGSGRTYRGEDAGIGGPRPRQSRGWAQGNDPVLRRRGRSASTAMDCSRHRAARRIVHHPAMTHQSEPPWLVSRKGGYVAIRQPR